MHVRVNADREIYRVKPQTIPIHGISSDSPCPRIPKSCGESRGLLVFLCENQWRIQDFSQLEGSTCHLANFLQKLPRHSCVCRGRDEMGKGRFSPPPNPVVQTVEYVHDKRLWCWHKQVRNKHSRQTISAILVSSDFLIDDNSMLVAGKTQGSEDWSAFPQH